jgi:hypothetical protein
MYILMRTDQTVPGVEIIGLSTGGSFVSGHIDITSAKRFGDGIWMQEITKDEAEAIVWCWGQNSRRIDDGRGQLIKVFPSEEELVNAVKVGKKMRLKQNADVYSKKFAKVKAKYGELEMATWSIQLAEAKAFKENAAADTPIIDIIINKRDVQKDAFATDVINKSNSYNIEVAQLLNEQKIIDDKIKACEDLDTLWAIKPEGVQ